MLRSMVPALLLLGCAAPLAAQTPTPRTEARDDVLKMRADSLLPVLAGGGDVAAVFSPATLAQLPEPQVRAVSKQLSDAFGKPLGIASVAPAGPYSGRITVRYERGTVDMSLAVEPVAPYRLTGLRILGTSMAQTTLDAVVAAIEQLPGVTGFALAKLGDGEPAMLRASKPDGDLAIGSAFKLAILAELIRATAAGERHWDDLVTLDGKSLPGGFYTQKPAGTQVSLRELAGKMISVSDNSATDIVLATVGREKVEAMLPVIGWRHAARNRPMIGTLEAFKLKAANGGALGTRWATLDERGRRALLAGEVAATPNAAIDATLFARGVPVRLDIEWYASPADLVRTMNWIRRHTESGPAAEARAILAINPGIAPAQAARFAYVGYKGGSEPGVIELTYLLRGTSGAWFAVAAGWNNPAAAVEDARFLALASRAVELAETPR